MKNNSVANNDSIIINPTQDQRIYNTHNPLSPEHNTEIKGQAAVKGRQISGNHPPSRNPNK